MQFEVAAVDPNPACVVYPKTFVAIFYVANYPTSDQPLLALPPYKYRVWYCDISQFLCDPATAEERL